MKISKLPPKFIIGLILALFIGIALYLRISLPYDRVFSGDWIKFTGVDAYYHMRLVDNLVHNFPHAIRFDPYMRYPFGLYPFGPATGNISFFDWLLAGVIWLIGLGSPGPHTIDVVGAYFPAVLAALTVIPVYVIGKELFGRWAGVIAAGLLVIIPGEYMGRSILGFTDYHVAETLFTATAIMFLVLAIKSSRDREITFNHIRQWDWKTLSRPVIFSLLGGIFLAAYLLTWIGAVLFVFIISLYFFLQFVIDHLRRQPTFYLAPAGVIFFLAALIIYLLFSGNVFSVVSLSIVIAALIPVVLNIASHQWTIWKLRPVYYPVTFIGLGAAGMVLLYFVAPSLIQSGFGIFSWSVSRTIIEMQPIFFPSGNFTFLIVWGNFTTGFFISLAALGFLVYQGIKYGNAERNLLLVWSLIILLAALGQRRFAYYFAANVAILTGYLSWRFLSLAGFRKRATLPVEASERLKQERTKARPKKIQKTGFRLTTRHINMALAVIIVFFAVIFPNIGPAVATAQQALFAPSDAWVSSLIWLRENTPEPFADPDYYYRLYEPPPRGESYTYPESAYAVTAWTDYGYWIARIAHRPVNSTPGPGGADVAQFFLAQDEDSAREIVQKLDSSYIIIDYLTTGAKFWALAQWAGQDGDDFFEIYYLRQEGGFIPGILFYPKYYRSLVVRLFSFDGQAVMPQQSTVIAYEEGTNQEGQPIKLITEIQQFPSYEEAAAYISTQGEGNYRIVSDHPFVSPVPLEALEHYQLIHSSDETVPLPRSEKIPEVKIFQYTE